MELEEIGKLIKTQDNRITDQPMFIVQQKKIDWGYDPDYVDDYEWYNEEEDRSADDDEVKQLENYTISFRSSWEKRCYKERWEFVTACFTEQGCKNYLKINGHNLKEPRIYAEGSYRNNEFRAVRDMLIGLESKSDLQKNVMKYCKTPKSNMNAPLWGVVHDVFMISYDEAKELCVEMGEDPEFIVLADPDWTME